MAALNWKIFGTPPNHENEVKGKDASVQAPEFEITQYVKKLGVSAGILAGAATTALKLIEKSKLPDSIVIAALGFIAIVLFGVCLICAVDIAARAYVTKGEAATKDKQPAGGNGTDGADGGGDGGDPPAAGMGVSTPPAGLFAWLEKDEEPRLVLAIAGDGAQKSAYLLTRVTRADRKYAGRDVSTISGPPQWHKASKIESLKPAKWP